MPFSIGPLELALVLVLALLILGPGKLPEAGAALARTLRDVRNLVSSDDSPTDQAASRATVPTEGSRAGDNARDE